MGNHCACAPFLDRDDAGRQLAEKLASHAGRLDVIVLGLPRGGVPVAARVAEKLDVPLDVFVVRKLGVPWHSELAMGAIASGGMRVLNDEVLSSIRISREEIEAVAAREISELERREQIYLGERRVPDVRGKTVIVVDDGVATGATMSAAIAALRLAGAARIVAAAPVVASDTCARLRREADDLVCVLAPENFYGVGQWYADFAQTTDEEVREALKRGG
jgi:predicted phosphoribosyltransferase